MPNFLTIRFSGCGHLLPYHLGVASVFHEETSTGKTRRRPLPPVKAVSGASSGAIAAVMYANIPDRIDEFANEFIEQRGNALKILTQMMYTEEDSVRRRRVHNLTIVASNHKSAPPRLNIATTNCADGSLHLFTFTTHTLYKNISSTWTTDKILNAVKASCNIPPSFHPIDLFTKTQYPTEEGIEIDGVHHTDGAISCPAPPTSRDDEYGAHSIIVSPISEGEPFVFSENPKKNVFRISPVDTSLRLLPLGSLKLNGNFHVKPSVNNLKCLRMASGSVSSDELRDWYDQGINDGIHMVNRIKDMML